jgi:hypothetical protein
MGYFSPPLSELDARDPAFVKRWLARSVETRMDIKELVEGTKRVIADSREAMVEADRRIARR